MSFFSRAWWVFEGWINGDPPMPYWDPEVGKQELLAQLQEDVDFFVPAPTEEWRNCTHEPKCWRYLPWTRS